LGVLRFGQDLRSSTAYVTDLNSPRLRYQHGHKKFTLAWCAVLYAMPFAIFVNFAVLIIDNRFGRSGSAVSYMALLARECSVWSYALLFS
jgi:hypothetical protein